MSFRTSPRPHRRLAAVAAVLAFGMLATACSSPSAAEPGSGEKNGGTLVYLDAELSRDTQLQTSGTWQDSAYIQNIGDRLIFRDPETQELKPWIAQSWKVSDDGLTYEFTIRDGVTYSDNSPLDAASVERNLRWQSTGDADKGIPANNWFPKIAEISSDNAARTVTVTLTEPNAPFLAVLSFWRTALASDATINATKEKQSQVTGFIGSGPFVVESEKYGQEIVFTKRKGYAWAPEGVENQGEAYLDKIVVIPVTEDSVRLGSLTSGEADLIRYIQPSEEKALTDKGFTVVGIQGVGNANVWDINQAAPFLDDIKVRQALQSGIDRTQIINDLYTQNWEAATSIVTPGTLGYKDESAKLGYDPERSKKLLDEAGWSTIGANGIREKDGKPLHILTYVDVYDSTAKPLFQLVQWQLKQIGIDLEIKETDYANYAATYTDKNVGVRRNGWPEADPVRLTVSYHSEFSNIWALDPADKKLDSLLADNIKAIRSGEREALLGELQDHVIDQAYALPIINDTQVFAYNKNVQDFAWGAEARPWFYGTWTTKK